MVNSDVEVMLKKAEEMLTFHEKAGADERHLKPLRELMEKRNQGYQFQSEQEILCCIAFGDPQAYKHWEQTPTPPATTTTP